MKNIPALLAILALLCVGLLVFKELHGPSETDIRTEERNKAKNEFKHQLDSLALEHEIAKRQRDSVYLLIDSVRRDFEKATAASIKKDKEIAALKGKYNDTPQDSLGVIMDRRADANQ